MLKAAGAEEPDPSRIHAVRSDRLDAKPVRLIPALSKDSLSGGMPNPRLSRNRPGVNRYHLLLCIAPDGTVKQALVVGGMPGGASEEVRKAALKFRFQPAMKNGEPVEAWEEIYSFSFGGLELLKMVQ